ncbi:hypothetical protein Cob_v005957 [Colletotrichum orbiculare MAFF 240422]|uniref:Uncharacterized protein n=1 Tax=Colletotrichum orbiculare (strain 104-T / ATCC 96160 / CBS 514.97 / LARS 414 / MAFF 240422) TaxID=1213857 RepID=A0A484FSQ9_COLOR|nr:hypothetical protein Cob_v005957 [Colletotrichum orbiculare MAFF 240422]
MDLTPFHLVDIFAGAVKARLWSEGFTPIGDDEWPALRVFAGLVLDLGRLSAEGSDLLAVTFYARRHVTLLSHILSAVPVPSESSFDRFGTVIIESRTEEVFRHVQLSPRDPANVEIEMQLWMQPLIAGWVHHPLDLELAMGPWNLLEHDGPKRHTSSAIGRSAAGRWRAARKRPHFFNSNWTTILLLSRDQIK